jgi:hypothetical protein
MGDATKSESKQKEPERVCKTCGHLECLHAPTGTRPCLEMTGDLLSRNFCKCDAFAPKVAKAA